MLEVIRTDALEGVLRVGKGGGWGCWVGRGNAVALAAGPAHRRDGWGDSRPEDGSLGPSSHRGDALVG